ncbi:DUF417 family protein [uncultured Methylovirgula sp.]|uniref:DUF417 family protein n=1 Tax=uncultured Methylovirgula sp. TaxID=1285960 RepID=UPI0026296037|nr:DUF417 family protein [uncultured Methylovirgula sp.]
MASSWNPSAGGFPKMTGNVSFLMKDVALRAVSIHLFKQDLARESCMNEIGVSQRGRSPRSI